MKLCILLCFFMSGFSALAFSSWPWESSEAFLKYEVKKKQLEQQRDIFLSEQLKRKRNHGLLQKNKSLFEHEKKQKQFELKRKQAFSNYKKKYMKYKINQKLILENRLRKISKMRSQRKFAKDQFFRTLK